MAPAAAVFSASTKPAGVLREVAVEAWPPVLVLVMKVVAALVCPPVLTLKPLRSKVLVPANVRAVPLLRAVELPIVRVPALTVVAPVWVLTPLRVMLPAPFLVRPSVPTPPFWRVPLKVVLVASPNVSVAAVAAWLFCTVPFPVRERMVLLKPLRRRIPVPLTVTAELALKEFVAPPCRMAKLGTVVAPL